MRRCHGIDWDEDGNRVPCYGCPDCAIGECDDDVVMPPSHNESVPAELATRRGPEPKPLTRQGAQL